MTHTKGLWTAVLLSGALATALGGCAGKGARARAAPAEATTLPPAPVTVVLDGNVDEWPPEAAGVADGRYLYVRFAVADDQFALEAAPKSLSLFLNTDGRAETGLAAEAVPIPEAAGADLEVQFSPRADDGTLRTGVAIHAIGPGGARQPIRAADADFTFAPTFAAGWYEARITRRLAAVPALSRAGGVVRGVVVLTDSAGQLDGYADPFEVALPPLDRAVPAAGEIPAAPEGSIRIVSYNVFKGRPVERPEAFARLFKALNPDVVLVQEWPESDASEIKAWFTTLVPSSSGWNVVASRAGGVAIVSRHPVSPAGLDTLQLPASGGQPHPIRFIAATVSSPAGDLAIGSAHLKCCGGLGSAEDATRLAEAQAINQALRQAWSGRTGPRMIGGDLNLVASRPPLDALVAGLDASGDSLSVISPPVLGDAGVFYTWFDPASEFVPGRLDYLLLGASGAQAVQAFVLDTSRLSAAALSRHGLRPDDTRLSDHLPVVADVMPHR